jgi:hypothetical protein
MMYTPAFLISAALVLALVANGVFGYRQDRDGTWHVYKAETMRRWINGAWQYRPMTDEELMEDFDARAW